jgi:Flp pilus assembly protein TadG
VISRSRRGANAIEFALVMPVLFAIVTGIMDYSWVFMLRNGAMNAARIGARTGSVTAQGDDPNGAAAASALEMWSRLGVGGDPTIVAWRTGEPELMAVRVTVDVTNTIGFVLGPTKVQVTAVERMEDQP